MNYRERVSRVLSGVVAFAFLSSIMFFSPAEAEDGLRSITFSGNEATIIRLKGNVKVLKSGEADWEKARQAMQLVSGDSVKTGKVGSFAELCFNYSEESKKKNVIRVNAGTQIKLEKIKPNDTEVKLDKGELFCIVEKMKKGSTFKVRTPVAICGARGTGWVVKHASKTIGSCFEHSIYMEPLDDSGNPTGDKQNVNEGHKKTIGSGEYASPIRKISPWQKRRWNSWRRNLGSFFNKNISGDEGPEADPYTPPPDKPSDDLGKDADGLNKGSKDSHNDANVDKQGEQDSQGNQPRGDTLVSTELDSDGDGVLDKDDLYPNDPNRASGNDLDGDGIDDEFDSDIDGDGYLNAADTYPRDYYDHADSDGDGIRDNEDAFKNDPVIDPDTSVRGYGSRHEIRQKILDLIEVGELRNDIAQHTQDIYWRDMDARLTQRADAQMHKVMMDKHGNRVRVEQYVLRPADKKIQLINVNLRTGDTPYSGLTTLNWAMTFNRHISSDEIPLLPWEDYLTVVGSADPFRITSSDTTYYQVPSEDPNCAYPDDMKLELTHNADSIYEYTNFGNHRKVVTNYWQDIIGYEFAINGTPIFDDLGAFKDALVYSAGNPGNFVVALDSSLDDPDWDPNPMMPWIWTRTQTRTVNEALLAKFFAINNSGDIVGGDVEIAGLKDMLRVGYFDLENGSNLEALFSCLQVTNGYNQTRLQTRVGGPGGSVTSDPWEFTGLPDGTTTRFTNPIDIIIVPVNDELWTDWWND
ncbi:MAG: FecR domain-containing protein [Candidatus Omnitrophica bacterium]|nr:FecR domain-containing protein [Candidatus Omnitrophota bacterium]